MDALGYGMDALGYRMDTWGYRMDVWGAWGYRINMGCGTGMGWTHGGMGWALGVYQGMGCAQDGCIRAQDGHVGYGIGAWGASGYRTDIWSTWGYGTGTWGARGYGTDTWGYRMGMGWMRQGTGWTRGVRDGCVGCIRVQDRYVGYVVV